MENNAEKNSVTKVPIVNSSAYKGKQEPFSLLGFVFSLAGFVINAFFLSLYLIGQNILFVLWLIASLIFCFGIGTVGLFFSVLGLIRAHKTEQKGKVMAVFGIAMSVICIVLFAVMLVFEVIFY